MGITINEIKDKYEILLHKVNEEVIGGLPMFFLVSNSNSLSEIGQISLEVKKYYISQINKIKVEYPLYNEIKNERIISLDGYKYVIKDIKEDSKNNIKTITAYSKEKKLEKNNISVEDLGFYLQDKDEENDIYSLDDYMFDETGWRFGHIDNSVKYNEDGTPKMRWQESVDTSWLDYLKQNTANQFSCYVYFDTKNQLINLYDLETFGENLSLALSYDNYIKSLEKSTSSSDIVTKLKLVGNEDECVISEATVTGEDYIENFSFFIENNEMSYDLISALNKYYKIVEIRSREWKSLRDTKLKYQTELTNKKNEEKVLIEEIKALDIQIDYYESKAGTDEDLTGIFAKLLADSMNEINNKKETEKIVYARIRQLEILINDLITQMTYLNDLCKKKTATDEFNNLIFNDTLLNELKKFIYSETYADDSFYNAEELIKSGENKLNILCKPTRSWSIDVKDFTKRLISNGFRQQWNGVLGLGDVICLYDTLNDSEEFIYLVEYNKNYKNNSLNLTLSNKKESADVVRYINDFLKLAKNNNKLMVKNRRLWNAQKYNRLNLERKDVMK